MKQALQKILTGFAVGILSGLLGVGGGIFMVPVMVGWFGFAQHAAQATSLAMIIPTAFFGGAIYSLHGSFDLKIAAILTVASMVGATAGARIMTHLPAYRLKQGFGLLLLVAGIRMVWA